MRLDTTNLISRGFGPGFLISVFKSRNEAFSFQFLLFLNVSFKCYITQTLAQII